MPPTAPCDDEPRLKALRRYGILDTSPEEAFDGIARLAAHVCRAPIAVINFIDERRQWFKSEIGLGVRETPLDVSICAHAILQTGLFVIRDTTKDERFARNPLVVSAPHLRFYAGALLETSDGHALGTLCVLDHVPRDLDEAQGDALLTLARQVMAQLELRRELAAQARNQEELRRARDDAERANRVLAESEERHRCIAELTSDYALSGRVDEGGRVGFDHATEGLAHVTGYTLEEMNERGGWAALVHPEDIPIVQRTFERALGGEPAGGDVRIVTKGGEARWLHYLARGVHDPALGRVARLHAAAQDITERVRAEATIAEQVRLAEYGRDVGRALTQGGTEEEVLARCAGATVRHLHGAFARIWTADEDAEVLHLRASAGLYTHTDGPHARIPVGRYKIGLIAQERRPHLTNAVIGDPRIPAQDWAKAEGMVAFAGYPLVVGGRLVGVLAMFARHELSDATVQAMASVADEIALGIEQMWAERRLHEHREWLQVTLASIGDAVIATNSDGRITFLNGVAEALTGWPRHEAAGRDLPEVFRIVGEETRREVESPALRALREGKVVGLANHTVLLARDGTERAIDDSAAPIRDEAGVVMGAVLIFRDVEEKRRAERSLEASEARKAAILDTALDAIVTIDHEGRIVEWNPAAERTFGHGRGDVLGREMAGLIVPPALRDAHRRGLARYLQTGEGPVLGRRIEITAVRADGSEFPVELAITAISAQGPPIFTAHIRDITARRAVERRRKRPPGRHRGHRRGLHAGGGRLRGAPGRLRGAGLGRGGHLDPGRGGGRPPLPRLLA